MNRSNPWLSRRVLNYAHRGGAAEAPSSTIYAMRQALARGADGLEMDVHATADGHLVCSHDSTVDRTTNGSGAVADLTLAELKALDPAWWFVPGEEAVMGLADGSYPLRGRVATEPELEIPTLDEVLAAFPDVFLNLDIKGTAPEVAPYEEALAQALARFGRTDDVIVASFNDLATREFSKFAPDVATSAG
ncbi:MAG: glycerophosphodiester phosphodiesterase family protein, partial [Acidimicrobiales bacterium]